MTLLLTALVGCTDQLHLELMPVPDAAVQGGAGEPFNPNNPPPATTFDAGAEPDTQMMLREDGPLTCETATDQPWYDPTPCGSPIRWQLVLSNGEPTSWHPTYVAFDASGNLYWMLSIYGHLDLGGREIGDPLTRTTMVISYAPDGALRWVFDANQASASGLVVTDTQVCAVFSGDGFSVPGLLDPDVGRGDTLACFDVDGQVRWARHLDSSLTWVHGVSSDAQGNLYVAGSFQGELAISSSQRAVSRDAEEPGLKNDGFVASYAPDGAVRWLTTMGGPKNDEVLFVAALADGRVAIVGEHAEDFAIGAGPTPDLGPSGSQGGAGFVALLDGTGQLEWAVRSPDSDFPDTTLRPSGLLLDARGRILASYERGLNVVAHDDAGTVTARYDGTLSYSGFDSAVALGEGFTTVGAWSHDTYFAAAVTTTDGDFEPQVSRVLVDPTRGAMGGYFGSAAVAIGPDGSVAVSGFWADEIYRRLVVLEP